MLRSMQIFFWVLCWLIPVANCQAQTPMLGKLTDYPSLTISLSHRSPTGGRADIITISWKKSDKSPLKVEGGVISANGQQSKEELASSVISEAFSRVNEFTSAFRFNSSPSVTKSSNEYYQLWVSSQFGVSLDLSATPANTATFKKAGALWAELRNLLPPTLRSLIDEKH